MVPCSTYLVQPGYFDIFFPTDFELLRDMYRFVMSTPPSRDLEPHGGRPSPLGTTASSLRLGSSFFSSASSRSTSNSNFPRADGERGRAKVFTHKEFMEMYADVQATTLRNGENPMLDFYQNVKFLF
jgi:hypothetical protein